MSENILQPFFIVGCVRSGTTILRNVLRLHPNLESPEETFFYRWVDPFGTRAYKNVCLNNPTIKKHRQIDKVPDSYMEELLEKSFNRRQLNINYAKKFLEVKGNPNARWFDKTPQNAYGILLIRAQFPKSKIIHIFRNPLNVVASLLVGKVVKEQSFSAALNYWIETMQIIQVYKKIPNNQLLEIKYEDFVREPHTVVQSLLEFLDEEIKDYDFSKLLNEEERSLKTNNEIIIHKERNKYLEVLNQKQIDLVYKRCGNLMKIYGYENQKL